MTSSILRVLLLLLPVAQISDLTALAGEVAALKLQQTKLERELAAIRESVQALGREQLPASRLPDPVPGLVGSAVPLGDLPALGNASSPVTVVELSDYHCPFCRRAAREILPRLVEDFVKTDLVRYVFMDYPIQQLHPQAALSHEAAACADDQGKYWEMHNALFAAPPVLDAEALKEKARTIGLNSERFSSCLVNGGQGASIASQRVLVQRLGITGTPVTLIGVTPAKGEPMRVSRYVFGAQKDAIYEMAIREALAERESQDVIEKR